MFGPTAVGKTELLLRLSADLPLEVISADSMQVYQGLEKGTARPDPQALAKLPHHLIGILSPRSQFSAGDFVRRCETLIPRIWRGGRIPVLSGGSAFYLRCFLYGLPAAPRADSSVRRALKALLAEKGLEALRDELLRLDPQAGAAIPRQDRYRILRALEVVMVSGRPQSSYAISGKPRDDYRMLLIGLTRERQELYSRIDGRVDLMFEQGLVEEVRGLLRSGLKAQDPGMRGIGYREFFEMMKGCLSLAGVRERIQQDSRRYAKRQMTFFRYLPGVHWHHPEETEEIGEALRNFREAALSTDTLSAGT